MAGRRLDWLRRALRPLESSACAARGASSNGEGGKGWMTRGKLLYSGVAWTGMVQGVVIGRGGGLGVPGGRDGAARGLSKHCSEPHVCICIEAWSFIPLHGRVLHQHYEKRRAWEGGQPPSHTYVNPVTCLCTKTRQTPAFHLQKKKKGTKEKRGILDCD